MWATGDGEGSPYGWGPCQDGLLPLPRCPPAGSIGGSFENRSEALGLLSKIRPLEVGVQWRALDNLLDGGGGLPKPHSLALAILPVLDSVLDPSK